jgi:hypothetical protein
VREALYLARIRIQQSLVSFGSTVDRLSSVSLADLFARKDLADFLLEALLDFLAIVFEHFMCNILSYLNIKNLPIIKSLLKTESSPLR